MAFLGVANRASCIRPGCHDFRLKNFRHQVYCNKCNETVSGLVRRGFVCNLCGFVLHEACFDGKTAGCRPTSVEQPDSSPPNHFWLDGNVAGKCTVCSRSMGSRSPTECSACVWCGIVVHPNCRVCLTLKIYIGCSGNRACTAHTRTHTHTHTHTHLHTHTHTHTYIHTHTHLHILLSGQVATRAMCVHAWIASKEHYSCVWICHCSIAKV